MVKNEAERYAFQIIPHHEDNNNHTVHSRCAVRACRHTGLARGMAFSLSLFYSGHSRFDLDEKEGARAVEREDVPKERYEKLG